MAKIGEWFKMSRPQRIAATVLLVLIVAVVAVRLSLSLPRWNGKPWRWPHSAQPSTRQPSTPPHDRAAKKQPSQWFSTVK